MVRKWQRRWLLFTVESPDNHHKTITIKYIMEYHGYPPLYLSVPQYMSHQLSLDLTYIPGLPMKSIKERMYVTIFTGWWFDPL